MDAANPQPQTFPRLAKKGCYCGCFVICGFFLAVFLWNVFCIAYFYATTNSVASLSEVIPEDSVEIVDVRNRGFFQSAERFWLLKVKDKAAVEKGFSAQEAWSEEYFAAPMEKPFVAANRFAAPHIGNAFGENSAAYYCSMPDRTVWHYVVYVLSEDGNYIYVHAVH